MSNLSAIISPGPAFRSRFKCDWRWFPVLCFVYLLLCFLFNSNQLVYSGGFTNDPDDYLRAVQVRNFIENGDWYNTREVRLNPPDGVEVFSRLVDLPIVAVALPLAQVMPLNSAIVAASGIVPVFLLLPLLFGISWWAYFPVVGRDWAWLSAPLLTVMLLIISEFVPGRIDHHGWQILLTLLAMGCGIRILQGTPAAPSSPVLGLVLSLSSATSFAVGVEAMPQILAIFAFIGLKLALDPKASFSSSILLGFSLPLFMIALVAVTRRPEDWFDHTLIAPSWIHIVITSLIGTVFICCSFLSRYVIQRASRIVAFGLIAGLALLVMVALVPDLIEKNFFLGFDDKLIELTRRDAMEQKAQFAIDYGWQSTVLGTLVALVGYLLHVRYSDRRFPIILLVSLTLAGSVAALFIATRMGRLQALASVPGIILFMRYGFAWIQKNFNDRRRFILEILMVLVCFGGCGAWLTLIMQNYRIQSFVNFPAESRSTPNCEISVLTNYLQIAYPEPQKILPNATIGPQLLFNTIHSVVGGGIYNNGAGTLDAEAFFNAKNEKEAAHILRKNDIDLVFVCGEQPINSANKVSLADDNMKFFHDLSDGTVPTWLKPLNIPLYKAGTLYKVVKENLP